MGILGGSSDSDGKDSEGKNQSESSSKASRQGGASSSGGGPLSLKALDNFRREGAAIWQDAQKQGAAVSHAYGTLPSIPPSLRVYFFAAARDKRTVGNR